MDPENTSAIRLELLPCEPTTEHLLTLFAKAHDQPGTIVRIPWVDEASNNQYTLSVQFSLRGGDPQWTLKRGLGTHAATLFVHRSGDVTLIHNLLAQPLATLPSIRVPTALEDVDQNRGLQETSSVYKQLNRRSQSQAAREAGDVTTRLLQETSGVYKQLNSRRATQHSMPSIASLPGPAGMASIETNTADGNAKSAQLARAQSALEGEGSYNVLVGELLLHAGFVTQTQLNQAIPIAQRTGLPIGRILEESGVLNQSIVQAAVLAQSLIRDKLLHLKLGVKALHLVGAENITLEESLRQLGWRSDYYEVANKLGQLLIDARVIDEQQLKLAFEVCFATGLPLGRVLVLRKMMPDVVAYTALSAQVFLRDGKITRENAISAIREAAHKKNTIQGSINATKSQRNHTIRLGELLVLAGVVSEVDLVSAIEAGLSLNCMIGQVLVRANIISEPTLKCALMLQEKANTQKCSVEEAVEQLRTGGIADQAAPSTSVVKGDETVQAAMKAAEKTDTHEVKRILEKLLLERENLAFKLVSEHEEIKNRLARELHDTIIADLMMLKRYLSGDRQMTVKETIDIVDDVVRQLRDICNDFVPKHLQEWGLKTTLQDLMERVTLRTGMRCTFECEPDLKNLPEAIHLHIFRIIQECLTNIEKYAKASKVELRVVVTPERQLLFTVRDNGQGFESDSPRTAALTTDGGRGLHGMKERVQLIRCYLPTALDISSTPGQGCTVSLRITPGN